MRGVEQKPQPMPYHGPGWTLDLTLRDEFGDVIEAGPIYQLWAPQDGAIPDPHEYAEYQAPGWTPRGYWAASWQSPNGDAGDYKKAATWRGAVSIFESAIRTKFAAAILDAVTR